MTDFRIHSATLDGTILPGCTGYAAQQGRQVNRYGTSGSAHRRLVSAGKYAQVVTLRTAGLKAIINKMIASGSAPIPCASLASGTGLLMAASAVDPVLPADTAGAAERMTITKGLIQMAELTFGEVGDACESTWNVYPLSADGDANAWSLAQGAIPSLPTAEQIYTLHAITWKGSSLDGMTGGKLITSTNPTPWHNPGKIYPEYIRQAPLTGPIGIDAALSLPDRSVLRSWGQHFHGAAAGDLVMEFRPYLHAAARDTDAITFTLTGVGEVTDATDGNPSGCTLNIHGVKTDGTSPLTWVD